MAILPLTILSKPVVKLMLLLVVSTSSDPDLVMKAVLPLDGHHLVSEEDDLRAFFILRLPEPTLQFYPHSDSSFPLQRLDEASF